MTVLLDEVEVLDVTGDPSSVDVRGVAYDSRMVLEGSLFCCLPGALTDGHDHAGEAIARGAAALLCERPVQPAGAGAVPEVRVAPGQARTSMARVSAAFYGFPTRDLFMAGVTGTNGKTTVSHLMGAIFEAAGMPATVVGTLSGVRTTPESPDLQALLAGVRDAGAGGPRRAVAMEVSSHALAQARVDAIRFDVAVFTNLSHEHLDFHGTMEAYFEAKSRLFTPERAVRGVVNADDPWGRRLLARGGLPLVTVTGDQASSRHLEIGRSSFVWRGHPVTLGLTGDLNVLNALLAAEAAVAAGVDPDAVVAGLEDAEQVPGRLEPVAGRGEPRFAVIVDYAHTPAGLEQVLSEVRGLVPRRGRVIVVFGCGGNRDRAKRPLMGAAAVRGSDVAIVTSDNPRDEDPGEIIEEVLAGARAVTGGARLAVVRDRRRAIATALDEARRGDVVVVAGKGHETYQEVGGERLPFDDRQVVRDLLDEKADLRRAGDVGTDGE